MKQLRLRGLDEDLCRHLERLADERDIPLSEAALLLMRRGAGLAIRPADESRVGDSLDDFIGSWGPEEERVFLESIAILGRVDASAST